MALQVIDRAIQSFGAEGVSQDTPLAYAWAGLRTLRLADVRTLALSTICVSSRLPLQGPDAVHIQQVGQRELKRATALNARTQAIRQKEKQLAEQYNVKTHI